MLRGGCLLLLATGIALADQGTWADVERLDPGAKVQVRTRTRWKVSGKLYAVSADAIEVESRKGVVSVAMGEVRKVRARSLKRRFRRAGLIAGAGAGAGAALGSIANSATYNDRFRIISPRDVVLGAAIAVSVVAFGIGMIPPASRTVYEVN